MTRDEIRGWATPVSVLIAAAAVCAMLAIGDAAERRSAERVVRSVERVETELVTARTPAYRVR